MKKILLCDDDRDITSLMKIIIEGMDIEFACYNRIIDIISLVRNEKPNLILMDLWIPDIGGEKAIEELKTTEDTKDIPAILFSASDKIEQICDEIGADGCIRKPFDLKFFKNHIKELLEL
ncbi:MAG: response regulator [Cyclobacteriaceae bacterium]